MGVDWWTIGNAWRVKRMDLSHGDLVRVTETFATEANLRPNTVRGYKAAVEFVERLQADGLVDEAGVRELAALPLKSVSVLQRVARYGFAELEPMLRLLLGSRPVSHHELEAMEAAVRRRPHPGPGRDANAHAFRLRAKVFRSGALSAWAAHSKIRGGRTAVTKTPTQIEPFVVDALATSPAGYDGIRLVAETAGTTVRPRLAETLLPALAAARAFHSFILMAQSTADADELAARVQRVGKCGVGVWRYDPARGMECRLEAKRSGAPDLAGRYAEVFAALFSAPKVGGDAA